MAMMTRNWTAASWSRTGSSMRWAGLGGALAGLTCLHAGESGRQCAETIAMPTTGPVNGLDAVDRRS
jgi:hypothetical protein